METKCGSSKWRLTRYSFDGVSLGLLDGSTDPGGSDRVQLSRSLQPGKWLISVSEFESEKMEEEARH